MKPIKTKYIRTRAILLFVFLLASGWTKADSLALKDGDTLSGVLIEITHGTLVFRTAYAGLMVVPIDEVKWIDCTNYFSITMIDQRKLIGHLTHDGKTQNIRIAHDDKIVSIELSQILKTVSVATELQDAIKPNATVQPVHTKEFNVKEQLYLRLANLGSTDVHQRLYLGDEQVDSMTGKIRNSHFSNTAAMEFFHDTAQQAFSHTQDFRLRLQIPDDGTINPWAEHETTGNDYSGNYFERMKLELHYNDDSGSTEESYSISHGSYRKKTEYGLEWPQLRLGSEKKSNEEGTTDCFPVLILHYSYLEDGCY